MKIDITDLKSIENQIEEHEVTAGFSSFRSRMGEFPITKKEPFFLHLEQKENQSLAVCGKTKITILVPCDRCLKETAARRRRAGRTGPCCAGRWRSCAAAMTDRKSVV